MVFGLCAPVRLGTVPLKTKNRRIRRFLRPPPPLPSAPAAPAIVAGTSNVHGGCGKQWERQSEKTADLPLFPSLPTSVPLSLPFSLPPSPPPPLQDFGLWRCNLAKLSVYEGPTEGQLTRLKLSVIVFLLMRSYRPQSKSPIPIRLVGILRPPASRQHLKDNIRVIS